MRNPLFYIRSSLLLAALFSFCPAFAADEDSGNYLSIGLGYRISQSLFSGDASGLVLYINGRYQWRGMFVELPSSPHNATSRPTIGYNFFNTEHWFLDAVYVWTDGDTRFYGTFNGDSVDFSRDQSQSFGLRATSVYGDYILQLALLPFNNEEYNRGTYASAHIAREWQISNWTVRGILGAQYRSKEIMDYYFGVDSDEATPVFPEYTAKGGTRFSMQLEALYPLTRSVVLSGYVAHKEFSDSAKDSPLLRVIRDVEGRPKNETQVGVVLNYVF